MFRFIHTADIHLDSPMEGLAAYDGAPVDALRGATRRAFENLIDLALHERVDFVVIAGDLYDGDWKDFSTGLFFTRQMARLHEAGIPVYLVAGNHDAASVLTRRLGLPDNVHRFSSRAPDSRAIPGLPVTVHGRSFPNRAVPENLVPDYPPPAPGHFNLGLLHTSLTGAEGHDTYAPCSLQNLADKGYDYWALGHVHQPQVVQRAPWVVYPGNLQGRHVREAGARGCRLVTVSGAREVVSADHVPLDVVRWARLEVDLGGLEEEPEALRRVREALEGAVAEADGRLLAARLVLTGATPLHGWLRRDLPALRAQCIVQAQTAAGDGIWLEDVQSRTAPVVDPAGLAERDELTAIVLESLAGAREHGLEVPEEVTDMLGALPPEIRQEVAADLEADRRDALLGEVRDILLESLARHGEGR